MERWNIVDGDCVALLRDMEYLRPVRLAFADPPYNIGVDYGPHYADDKPGDAFLSWCATWMLAVADHLSDNGSFWILVNHELAFRIAAIGVDAIGLTLRQVIIWRETFGANCIRKFNRTSRPLLHFVKDPSRFVFNANAPEVRRPSDRSVKYNDSRANPFGKLHDDVWDISRVCGTFGDRVDGFPTQLPLTLLRRIVACASNPGDLVVDPFSGSATTGVACVEMGRDYLGIELSPTFAELSRARMSEAISHQHVVH